MDQMIAMFTLLGLVASILLHWWHSTWLPSKRLPPGPTPWPVVGCIPQLPLYVADVLSGSRKLQEKYGKMITFWIGKRPLIIINDPDLAFEAMVRRGSQFNNRCRLSSQIDMSNGFKLISSSDGDYTKLIRRVLSSGVLGAATEKALKPQRDSTLNEIMSLMVAATRATGGVRRLKVSCIVRPCMFRFALVMSLGFQPESKPMQRLDDILMVRMNKTFRFYFGDYIPALKFFERKSRQYFNSIKKECEKILIPVIEKVRRIQARGRDESGVVINPGSYLHDLLALQETEGRDFLSDETIVGLLAELIISGSHTVSLAAEYAMHILSEHPDVQAKVRDEIRATLGDDARPVDESDIPNLPYLAAVVKETLRLIPPSPVTMAHATSELCQLGGYDIPTNAVIYFQIRSFHLDSTLWTDEPLGFKPERFLDMDVDVLGSGTRDLRLIPFGAGRRVCPAAKLAMMELQMMVARMVQTFDWMREHDSIRPGDMTDVDLPKEDLPGDLLKITSIARLRSIKT
ncbi:hypothetical protein Mapa_001363 [Marchantia paleacea]|nr:hypothetical protein Mapa_001363 [Marchantia paleacea]